MTTVHSSTKQSDRSKNVFLCPMILRLPSLCSQLEVVVGFHNDLFLRISREKERVKERDEMWVKVGNLAKHNPQVCSVF